MIKEEVKLIIEKLREKEDIVVVPSAAKDEAGKHLRVYQNGGLILGIPLTKSAWFSFAEKGYADELDGIYSDYNDKERRETYIKSLLGSNDKAHNYFTIMSEAINRKWTKKSPDKLKERNIQTQIVKNHDTIIDMEFGYNSQDKTVDGWNGKIDLVVFDGDSFGIIELKYNCDSCDNINKHIEDMNDMCNKLDRVSEELNRRMKESIEYGLISDKLAQKYTEVKKENIWFGFLFVGGGEDKAEGIMREQKNKDEFIKLKNFYFCYCDSVEEFDPTNLRSKKLSDLLK